MFLRELVEVVLHHLPHKSLHLAVGSAVYLEHQTLLQRVRPYARRVERLEYGNHPVHLLRCHVDVVIYCELVADTLRVFPEQTVVVERSDDIFHHLPALRVKLRLPHLLLEFVVERCGVAVHTFLILRPVALFAVVQCRHLVVAPDVLECCVERVVAVLPLLHGVEVGLFRIERSEHRHREDVVQDGLADVVDVRAAFRKHHRHRRDDAAAILAQNRDNALHGCTFHPFLVVPILPDSPAGDDVRCA